MRQGCRLSPYGMGTGFNLRREAAPHATVGEWCLDGFLLLVSISDEKPLHMRPTAPPHQRRRHRSFNLRREAAPHATYYA